MLHPYSPETANIPGYVAKQHTREEILVFFFSLAALVVTGVWQRASSVSNRGDRVASVWWVTTGLIHMFTEGWWVVTAGQFAGRVDIMSDLW